MSQHLIRSSDISTSAYIYIDLSFTLYYSSKNIFFYINSSKHSIYLILGYYSSPPTKMKSKFIKSCEKKLKKMTSKVNIPCTYCEACYERICWAFKKEDAVIPKDVPKGHMVVYVGEEYRRFVIKINLLKHPLFQALLDQAQDAYGFSADSRLWIPCNESTFLDVVRCCWCSPASE